MTNTEHHMSTEMNAHSQAVVAQHEEVAMSPLLHLAIEKGVPVETLAKLVELHERVAAREAAKAFADAMTRFKAACPPVPRRAENTQFHVTRGGVKVARRYASLEGIEATIRGPASDCGLSFRWGDARVDNGLLTLACIVSHTAGHSEASHVTLPLESRAGCSEAQKYGSVMTYAQRYSLVHAFGLTTCDEDLDGANGHEVEYVTGEQADAIEALLNRCPPGTLDRMLKYVGVGTIDEIPAARYTALVSDLEKKAKAAPR
jgi:hypothetical protein